MNYLFTSESVSPGHPDKIADRISDAILDAYLEQDKESKVACETLVTTGQVVIAGEVKSKAIVDHAAVARRVINDIGYNKSEYMFDANSCGILTAIHQQSADINRGVEKADEKEQGAGDQGMMFGYACNETEQYMPLTIFIAHSLLSCVDVLREENDTIKYLRPDAKSQVTVEYDENTNKPVRVNTIVLSLQHDEFADDDTMHNKIVKDVKEIILPFFLKSRPELQKYFDDELTLHVNPTGKFAIGGPHGDTGLTGRKIIVDTYGGHGAHGGGAFSGKDPSKVDRSAAYAARHIAKNLVAADVCDRCLVQISYAIGVAEPVSICVNTYGTAKNGIKDTEIAEAVTKVVDLRPHAIIENLNLKSPIYEITSNYGHFGHESIFYGGKRTYPWEMLDLKDEFARLLLS